MLTFDLEGACCVCSPAALLMLQGQIWDATRPKFDPEALTRPPRPTLYNVEEEELEDVDTEEWKLRLKGKRY